MTGPPPASTPPGAPPPQPFPVYPYPAPMRYKPGEPAFIPHLTYMEGQFAAQALLVEQQRRIKALEAELASTQMELMRLRNMSAPQRGVVPPRMTPPVRPDGARAPPAPPPPPQHDEAKKASSRYWTAEEHNRFLEGLELFGQKDIKAISRHVGTRSATQVRTHAQKYYLRIERERAKAEAEGKPPPPSVERLPNGKRPPGKTKPSPTGSASRGHSNHSNSGNSHPHNTHSPSHNNSSSSNRNLVNNTVHTNTSNNSNEPDGREHASATLQPPLKSEQLVHSAPLQAVSCATQPYLAAGTSGAVTTPSGPSVSLPHLSSPSASALPRTDFKPPVAADAADPHMGVRAVDGSMATTTDMNVVGRQHLPGIKAEDVQSSSQVIETDAKPPLPSMHPVEQKPTVQHAVKQPDRKDPAKRSAPATPKRSPKKRAKKPGIPPSSASAAMSAPQSQAALPKMNVPTTTGAPPSRPLGDSGGSMSNLRALLRVPDDAGPSSSKPPTLRRNGSSNSVLADLSKNVGVLSRSNSFVSPNGKGVTRSNSILSLLSGIPTALRESPSTERLLGLDGGEDKVMATLKAMDTGGSSTMPALGGPSASGSNAVSTMGDRSFSFGQLNHMGLDDLEDPGAVALALQEEQKWGDG